MSLINRMLQDLDARRSDTMAASGYGEQVRAVALRRGIHPAWWVVIVLAILLAATIGWLLVRPVGQGGQSRLPLKLDVDLSAPPASSLPIAPPPTVPVPAGDLARTRAATAREPAQP
ncbi:hypothetical protein E4K72_01720, partial [Oxalobacteraceae bacterium OM1]